MNLDDVQLVAFDLDDTLAPSKSSLPGEMRDLLARLTGVRQVAVISGGNFEQFRRQIVDQLMLDDSSRPDNLHLLPACGTQYYRWHDGSWRAIYAEPLTVQEREHISKVLQREAESLGLWQARTWGPIIEDRRSQVTFSALGQEAPVAEKSHWDPDGSRRTQLREAIAPELPGFEVRVGGSTSVDITRAGVDKAYGMRRLSEYTAIPLSEMIFVGDQLQPGGNDNPVIELGVRSIAVSAWPDTARFVASALSMTTVAGASS